MNYFIPYPLCVDETVTTAWKSQVAEAAHTPWLAELLAHRGGELFPRFVATYTDLRALPRGARRALQRRLALSCELSESLQEWLQQRSVHGLQQKLACTLAGAALLLVLGRGVAEANNITVNTTIPGVVADNLCSLAEAILNANDLSTGQLNNGCSPGDPAGEDNIILPPKGSFALTAPSGTFYGYPTGLPLITSQITIEGNGAKIARSKKAPAFRLMAVSSTGDLELENLTLSGGLSNYGGAIYNNGELTISHCILTGNTAYYGGAIANNHELIVTDCNLSKNFAYVGGGIANNTTGTLTVTNSTITGNKAYYSGGIANGGNMEISGSAISKNSALQAGGIGNYGGSAPTQVISNSTISGNSALISKSLYGGYGGGIANVSSTLTIINSTISGNKASGKLVKFKGYPYPYFYGGLGGGIINYLGKLTLTGGMVTSNSATIAGGGLANISGTYTYTPGTITGNKAKYGADIISY